MNFLDSPAVTGIITGIVTIAVSIISSSWFSQRMLKKSSSEEILKKIESLTMTVEQNDAIQARIRILRFNDELLMHELHSKEYFDMIIADIDSYEKFCSIHKDNFVNNKAMLAIANIKECYKKCEKDGTFL